ncbi:MAG TPA: SPW repeat protein [Stellaceae bacterium]|nr:SPW repeat protein [Stellaceae bacterium]
MSDSMEIQESWNWQDWLDMVLGLWLAVSPWILDFTDSDPTLTRNAVIVGVAIAVLSALTFLAYHIVEEWIDVILGLWLVISPLMLSASGSGAVAADFVIVGAVVLLLSGYEIWAARHGHPHPE